MTQDSTYISEADFGGSPDHGIQYDVGHEFDEVDNMEIVTEHFDPELLTRCSRYVCEFLGYERPAVSADEKGPFPYPAIIPELYSQLHNALTERKLPVSDEDLAEIGFKVIYNSVDANGVKNPAELLQVSIDDQDEADIVSILRGAK